VPTVSFRVLAAALLLAVASACAGNGAVRAETLEAAARLDDERAVLRLELLVRSGAAEPLVARALEYEIRLGAQAVAVGSAAVGGASGVALPPGGTAHLELPLALARDQLPAEVARRLDRGGTVPVLVRGNVLVRRPGRARPLSIPFELGGTLAPAD